jgi:hypothetical protein
MIYRQYNLLDYDKVSALWEKWGHDFMPAHMLPSTGFIVARNDEQTLVSSCFLYHAKTLGGHIGWLEWFVVDKDASKKERDEALDGMMSQASFHLANYRYQWCYTNLRNPSLKKRLQKFGFEESERDTINMVWRMD